ncbi:ArdC-like ssDNA-binding domain-containing protein [Amycolatopsis azurea]|uniref:ArdC-like ssDNA-binding domain-containing protein n=1 Tax=Amycolatopsis azurea TaxID=36819 RepID=UPI003824DA7D
MGKRRRYTDAQRAERAAADHELSEQASAILADPHALLKVVGQLASIRSPRIHRFSLRNQVLLLKQAEERGVILVDVDTFKGWSNRGRMVRRGEVSYRVTVPKGREQTGEASEGAEFDEPAEQGSEGEGDGEEARTRFRMAPFFDISQTDGVDEEQPGYDAESIENVTGVLHASLVDQLERFGYSITTGDVPGAVVTADPPTVTVPEGLAVEDLAVALGSILSLPPKERPRQRPAERRTADDAGCISATADGITKTKVRLELGETYGTATAWIHDEWNSGTTVYDVKASRVSGMITVTSSDATQTDLFHAAKVAFGDWSKEDHYRITDAPGAPVINGVDVVGRTSGITRDRAQVITWRTMNIRKPDKWGSTEEAPQKTADRAAAVVRAILRHWLLREDLDTLHVARARFEAPAFQRDAEHITQKLDQQLAALTAERDEHAATAARYASLAETDPQHTDQP